MNLPFSKEAFIEVFIRYNEAIWPIQIIFYMLVFLCLFFILKQPVTAVSNRFMVGRWSFLFIAVLWVWMGAVYHLGFFSKINPAAVIFGILFIVQGFLFAFYSTGKNEPSLRYRKEPAGILGIIFILYSLFIYPVIGVLAGHGYPASPLFGAAPCPTTIFTFGLMLLSVRKIPFWLLIVPFLWSIIGGSAAILLGIPEDFGLPVAGIAGSIFVLLRRGHSPRQ